MNRRRDNAATLAEAKQISVATGVSLDAAFQQVRAGEDGQRDPDAMSAEAEAMFRRLMAMKEQAVQFGGLVAPSQPRDSGGSPSGGNDFYHTHEHRHADGTRHAHNHFHPPLTAEHLGAATDVLHDDHDHVRMSEAPKELARREVLKAGERVGLRSENAVDGRMRALGLGSVNASESVAVRRQAYEDLKARALGLKPVLASESPAAREGAYAQLKAATVSKFAESQRPGLVADDTRLAADAEAYRRRHFSETGERMTYKQALLAIAPRR